MAMGGSAPALDRIQGRQQPQQAAPPQEAAPQQPEDTGDANLDAFLDQAYTIIYGGDGGEQTGTVNPGIAESMREFTNTPDAAPEGLATLAAMISARVAEAGMSSGQPIDGIETVLPATLSLVSDLATIAATEGIYDFDQEEINAATVQSTEHLFERTQDLGLWNKDEFDQAADDLVNADRTGELDQMTGEMEMSAQPQGAMPPQGGPPV